MMEEHMIDMAAGYGEMWGRSWRCFNCGHRHDAVIQQHRKTHARPGIARPEAGRIEETVELPWDAELNENLAA
jgi:hypothetical protein